MSEEYLGIDPKLSTTAQVIGTLQSAVAPRPIALASTIDSKGRVNLSPYSFFNVFSANPPILIFSPSRRVRGNTTKHTLQNVLETGEVVINAVSGEIVQQISLSSSDYDKGVNEFAKSGLTELPSKLISPPRCAESPVQMECKVLDVISLGKKGGAGNLVICEVIYLHVNKSVLNEDGRIDQEKIDLIGRMGGAWYNTTRTESLFQVAKPTVPVGMGFDQLPKEILESQILSGNDLAQLANCPEMPNESEVNEYKLLDISDIHLNFQDNPIELKTALHRHAKALLAEKKVDEAWKALLTFNG
ncbi:MAG TPA: flavin reductase [Flavobacteriales bacterium]|jgi:flavin reductase (DIM6/NTAB) family NADH-FMN oxidoreductase RutF|nr:flavin reductase [Flavobacteriales bacterium]